MHVVCSYAQARSQKYSLVGTQRHSCNNYPVILERYSDASWIANTSDNKSTLEWSFTIAGGVVSWASKKQTCITHSTMENEFIALTTMDKKVEWLRNLLLI